MVHMRAINNSGPYNTGEDFHVQPSEVKRHQAYAVVVPVPQLVPPPKKVAPPKPASQAGEGDSEKTACEGVQTESKQPAEVKELTVAEAVKILSSTAETEEAAEVKEAPKDKKVTKPATSKSKVTKGA